jgi:hypothetical protein
MATLSDKLVTYYLQHPVWCWQNFFLERIQTAALNQFAVMHPSLIAPVTPHLAFILADQQGNHQLRMPIILVTPIPIATLTTGEHPSYLNVLILVVHIPKPLVLPCSSTTRHPVSPSQHASDSCCNARTNTVDAPSPEARLPPESCVPRDNRHILILVFCPNSQTSINPVVAKPPSKIFQNLSSLIILSQIVDAEHNDDKQDPKHNHPYSRVHVHATLSHSQTYNVPSGTGCSACLAW